MDVKEWKKRLADLLKENPAIDDKLTGKIEINLSEGGVTKLYKIETAMEADGKVKVTIKTEL
jgi:hypothetical protein